MFRICRQNSVLLNEKDESEYVILTYYMHLLWNIFKICRCLVGLNQYFALYISLLSSLFKSFNSKTVISSLVNVCTFKIKSN